jgi:hypothetical protein
MECSKKETWFATVKVKTVPAFFSEAKYDRLFVTQKVLIAEEDDPEESVPPGRNLHKDQAALDEAQQAARKRVRDHIKQEAEERLQSNLNPEQYSTDDTHNALDLGEIRKEAHRIYQREQEELKQLNPAEEPIDPELMNPPRIPRVAQYSRPLKAKAIIAEKDSE